MGHAGVSQSYRGGVSHAGVGGVGHVVKQPKNDSPQNQDLTPPKSFLEGVQNLNFENKKIYYFIIIIIVLYSQLYQKLLPDVPYIKIPMG